MKYETWFPIYRSPTYFLVRDINYSNQQKRVPYNNITMLIHTFLPLKI